SVPPPAVDGRNCGSSRSHATSASEPVLERSAAMARVRNAECRRMAAGSYPSTPSLSSGRPAVRYCRETASQRAEMVLLREALEGVVAPEVATALLFDALERSGQRPPVTLGEMRKFAAH